MRLEGLDAEALGAAALAQALAGDARWDELLADTPLDPHRVHALDPRSRARSPTCACTSCRTAGSIACARSGHALDGAGDRRALAALHALPEAELRALLLSCCGARAFVERVATARPVRIRARAVRGRHRGAGALATDDWTEAFAAHPRLGDAAPAPAQSARSAEWSRGSRRAWRARTTRCAPG